MARKRVVTTTDIGSMVATDEDRTLLEDLFDGSKNYFEFVQSITHLPPPVQKERMISEIKRRRIEMPEYYLDPRLSEALGEVRAL